MPKNLPHVRETMVNNKIFFFVKYLKTPEFISTHFGAKYGDPFMTPIFMLKHVSDDSLSHDIIVLSLFVLLAWIG